MDEFMLIDEFILMDEFIFMDEFMCWITGFSTGWNARTSVLVLSYYWYKVFVLFND